MFVAYACRSNDRLFSILTSTKPAFFLCLNPTGALVSLHLLHSLTNQRDVSLANIVLPLIVDIKQSCTGLLVLS